MKPLNCHFYTEKLVREDLISGFDTLETFDEDDHMSRRLVKCRRCSQLYFYAFDEEVDYKGGEDPQYRTWIPVESADEAAKLRGQSRMQFVKFSPRIDYSWPSDLENPKISWM